MTNQQSKAWSAALKRAARLIQQHYGLNYDLVPTPEEVIKFIARLNNRKAEGNSSDGDDHLLAQLEAAE